MNICKLNHNHVRGVAVVHVDSWRQTYANLIDDEYLSSRTYEDKEKVWDSAVDNTKFTVAVLENDLKVVVGFCSIGKSRDPDMGHPHELRAIYLLNVFHHQGWGKKLYESCCKMCDLVNGDMIHTWVLAGNPAIGFYTGLGGIEIGRKNAKLGSKTYAEIGLGWIIRF